MKPSGGSRGRMKISSGTKEASPRVSFGGWDFSYFEGIDFVADKGKFEIG